jgi:hypothetical protein
MAPEAFTAAEVARLRAALAELEAEAAAGPPTLRRAFGQLQATLAPRLWLDQVALGERLGNAVVLEAPLEAAEPSLLDCLPAPPELGFAGAVQLGLVGAQLWFEAGEVRLVLPWRCLRLRASALRLVPSPSIEVPSSLVVHAVPPGFGAGTEAPAPALGITVVGKTLCWVYRAPASEGPPSEGLSSA